MLHIKWNSLQFTAALAISQKVTKKSALLDRAWETHTHGQTYMFRNADWVQFLRTFILLFSLLLILAMPPCSRILCGHANLYVCHAITATNAVRFFSIAFYINGERIKMFQNVNLCEIVPLCDWNISFSWSWFVHTAQIDAKLPTMRKVEANDSDTSVECHQNSSSSGNRALASALLLCAFGHHTTGA